VIPPVSAPAAAAAAELALPRLEVVGPPPATLLAAAIGRRMVGVVASGERAGTMVLTTPQGSVDIVPSRPLAEGTRMLLAVRAFEPRLDFRVLAVDGPAPTAPASRLNAASQPAVPVPVSAAPTGAGAQPVVANTVAVPGAGAGMPGDGSIPAGIASAPLPGGQVPAAASATTPTSPSPPFPSAAAVVATTVSPPAATAAAVSAAQVPFATGGALPLPAPTDGGVGTGGGPPAVMVPAVRVGAGEGMPAAPDGARTPPSSGPVAGALSARPPAAPIPSPDGGVIAALAAIVAAWRTADAGRVLNDVTVPVASKRPPPGGPAADEARSSASDGTWRQVSLPVMVDDVGSRLLLVVRDRRDGATGDGRSGGDGRRFVVDLTLTRLGRLQLDGWIAEGGRRLDLCVRSDRPLPDFARDGIRGAFRDTADVTGLAGGVSFRAGPRELVALHAVPATGPGAGWLV
jgi:hypothetical protein